jgi:hypothetical protein
LLTSVAAMPAGAQEGQLRCKTTDISAAGRFSYFGEGAARRLAVAAWRREVSERYGLAYADFDKAINPFFDCHRDVRGALARFRLTCMVRAKPCAVYPDEGYGDRSVVRIQRWLSQLGYLDPYGVDGEYGPMTADAVRRFQRDAGLPATGEVDDATFERLRRRATQ